MVVLLPGIAASGSFYGAAFDRLGDIATVVVIDPLGFGHSMVEPDSEALFGISDHQNAIIDVLSSSCFASRPVTLVGHSMGASLAIITAAGAADIAVTVAGVIAFDAPLFVSEQEARQRVAGMGWFETLLAAGPIAHLVCSWMCRHRLFASYVAVALNPSLPVPVARDGVRHTWLSYTGALNSIVMSDDWLPALDTLGQRNIAVLLVNGIDDPVPAPGRADRLACSYPNLTALTHKGGHQLPLSDPD
ncbi:alpha/beta fold hydrolase [Gulosibacter sediminis]|nr:alpha/beta fold hydrolase [Gulosibacter sediminis]